MKRPQLKELMREIDTDGSGEVDFDEVPHHANLNRMDLQTTNRQTATSAHMCISFIRASQKASATRRREGVCTPPALSRSDRVSYPLRQNSRDVHISTVYPHDTASQR